MVDIARISYDELPSDLKRELRAKVERLGYLGEFFQICAYQPAALAHFIRFTETLKDGLPANLVELCALTISTWSAAAYERVQHENLALKLGMSPQWIHDVKRLEPDAATQLDAVEKAAQRLALAMARTQGRAADTEADELLNVSGPDVLVGVLLTVGRYMAHSAICNTLRLSPPVASQLAAQS